MARDSRACGNWLRDRDAAVGSIDGKADVTPVHKCEFLRYADELMRSIEYCIRVNVFAECAK